MGISPLRDLLILALCCASGGCYRNHVLSEKPLFSKADTRGTPAFRPGVWASPAPDCVLNPADRVQDWPECSNAFVMSRKGLDLHLSDRNESADMLLASGEPLVLQIALKGTTDGRPFNLVTYQGVQPTGLEASGRVIAFRVWNVLCGPPPATGSETGRTTALLPGLSPMDDNCVARDPATVRRAAAASAAWAVGEDETANPRWIRPARWWRGETRRRHGGSGLSSGGLSKPAERTEAAAEAEAAANAAASSADSN